MIMVHNTVLIKCTCMSTLQAEKLMYSYRSEERIEID